MWRVWKSPYIGWGTLIVVLAFALPLYLRMPLWLDATLYDVAARNLQREGVHYRDVFDTNLPGMVWMHWLIRTTCGWSSEALRVWDLGVMSASVLLLIRWLRQMKCSHGETVWFAVAVVFFYPLLREINHCQRDPWMLLPALAATQIRSARIAKIGPIRRCIVLSMLEGGVWGIAVWLKPHVIVPAFAVWLCTLPQLRWQSMLADTGGNLTGATMIAIPGMVWLIATGAWPHFWDIVRNWNSAYFAGVRAELPERFDTFLYSVRPWSVLHAPALLLACTYLAAQAMPSRWRDRLARRPTGWIFAPSTDASVRRIRALLAALYLGWLVQAMVLQRTLPYVQTPAILLALTLLVSQRWSVGFATLTWFATIAGFLVLAANQNFADSLKIWLRNHNREFHDHYLDRHPLFRKQCWRLWPRSISERPNASLKTDLAYSLAPYSATNWHDLERTAQFLRTIDPPLQDRELTCWHDSPHSLYLLLDLKPSIRFLHVATAAQIGPTQQEIIRQELIASPQRYVVSDLMRVLRFADDAEAPGRNGPNDLPPNFPRGQLRHFPWTEPIVFRSGRYVVHRVENPIGSIAMPKKPLDKPEDDRR